MSRLTRTPLFAAALLAPALAFAAPQDEERTRIEIESTLASLNERGLLAGVQGQATVLRAPAQQRWELGAVLDVADGNRHGPRVLAITPEGPAERMGLRVDDRITRINGIEIRGGSGGAARLMSAIGERDGQLRVDVFRNGDTTTLEGVATSLAVPGYTLTLDTGAAPDSDCGRIDVYPWRRLSIRVYPVVLHAINDRLPGAEDQYQFKLAPGRHVLKLSEQITDVRIGNEIRRAALERQQKNLREFVIDVEPGMTYRIGARFILEERARIEDGGYWEPVVWRSFGQSCRGAVFASPAASH